MTDIVRKIATRFLAPLAGVLLTVPAQASLIINSVDMHVVQSRYQVTDSSDLAEALAVFDFAYENNPVCSVSLESFDSVGSSFNCGGPRKNTGTLFMISGTNTGTSQLEFGLDWGRGGFSAISFGGDAEVGKYTQDIWWGRNWNHKDVLSFDFDQTGDFTMLMLGFDACCNGINSARWRSVDVGDLPLDDAQDVPWDKLVVNAASVPAPPVMWLFGLGLAGLAASRRRKNIQ